MQWYRETIQKFCSIDGANCLVALLPPPWLLSIAQFDFFLPATVTFYLYLPFAAAADSSKNVPIRSEL